MGTISLKTSPSSAETGRIVERGDTFCHEEYGTIEVTGIWRGTRPTDSASIRDHEQTVVIRYSPGADCRRTEDLADTLGDFLTDTS